MKKTKTILLALTLLSALQVTAQTDTTVTVQFQKQTVQGQNILVLSGESAAKLHKMLPSAGQKGASEMADTKGELNCSAQPEPGVGIQYQCFMVLK